MTELFEIKRESQNKKKKTNININNIAAKAKALKCRSYPYLKEAPLWSVSSP
jgi:hypothetical protein